MQRKLTSLGMHNTVLKEPTGLSPENMSTAADLAKMAQAASHYPEIVNVTTDRADTIRMNGRPFTFHNTNQLVGASGWNVLLSKTGFTNDAGRCLVLQAKLAERQVIIVLLDSWGKLSRIADANRVRAWLEANARPSSGGAHKSAQEGSKLAPG